MDRTSHFSARQEDGDIVNFSVVEEPPTPDRTDSIAQAVSRNNFSKAEPGSTISEEGTKEERPRISFAGGGGPPKPGGAAGGATGARVE